MEASPYFARQLEAWLSVHSTMDLAVMIDCEPRTIRNIRSKSKGSPNHLVQIGKIIGCSPYHSELYELDEQIAMLGREAFRLEHSGRRAEAAQQIELGLKLLVDKPDAHPRAKMELLENAALRLYSEGDFGASLSLAKRLLSEADRDDFLCGVANAHNIIGLTYAEIAAESGEREAYRKSEEAFVECVRLYAQGVKHERDPYLANEYNRFYPTIIWNRGYAAHRLKNYHQASILYKLNFDLSHELTAPLGNDDSNAYDLEWNALLLLHTQEERELHIALELHRVSCFLRKEHEFTIDNWERLIYDRLWGEKRWLRDEYVKLEEQAVLDKYDITALFRTYMPDAFSALSKHFNPDNRVIRTELNKFLDAL